MTDNEAAARRYTCYLQIKSVSLALPGNLKVFVVLRQGSLSQLYRVIIDNIRLETSGRVVLDRKTRSALFNETFTFSVTLDKPEAGTAPEKKVSLRVDISDR